MTRQGYEIEQNTDGKFYVMHAPYCLADVPRWVHDGSWDRNSVVPNPDLDWIYGPYATRKQALAEVAALELAQRD